MRSSLFCFAAAAFAALGWSAQPATFYLVDIGHGNVAFVISPSGETMLLDCGPSWALSRIQSFIEQNGIKKIDYLVVSHFEEPFLR